MPNLREPHICGNCFSNKNETVSMHDCAPTTLSISSSSEPFCDCPCLENPREIHTDFDSCDSGHDNGELGVSRWELIDLTWMENGSETSDLRF